MSTGQGSGVVRDALDVPERRTGNDALAVRDVIDAGDGCAPFTLRVLRAVRGRSFEQRTEGSEELLFVLRGAGEVIIDDVHVAVGAQTGVAVRPRARYELHNESVGEDLEVLAVALHDPEPAPDDAPVVSRLADAERRAATGARTFRIVFDADHGCPSATQFVGEIPVGAAPEHYHLYEEVIYVLDGTGVMHMNGRQTPLRAGSCIHLPPRKVHILENSGPDVMRVLGVFRPAGSPAAAFYPDGTPAYTADETQAAPAAP